MLNKITLPEIRHTNLKKNKDIKSKIITKEILEEKRLKISHSIIISVELKILIAIK